MAPASQQSAEHTPLLVIGAGPYGVATAARARSQGIDTFPVLDEDFQSSVPALYFTGFAATRDFGPFFGFTKGCPAAASLLVDGILSQS